MAEWRIPEFQEVRSLGSGAQGRVVLARHRESGTPVAIKYLLGADERDRERLRHEARMLGQADSPHIARLFRLVEVPEGAAIVMEAVDGVSLKEILERYGALGPEASLAVLKGSLLGLAAAHALGVVHRDYKPANVVVPANGCSKLIDFGIATPTGEAGGAGTPVYMAPEQWSRQPATPATDVYAATCVFVECVTGRRPFQGDGQAALMNAHLNAPVPTDGVPEPLRELVAAGLAKDPAERPAGAAAFVQGLEQVARETYGPDWETRGIRRLAGAAVALAALFPLAGLAVPGAAGVAGAAGAAGETAAAGGAKALLATTAGKIVVGGAAVVVVTGGAVAVQQTVKAEPKPRPTPTRSVVLAAAVSQCPVTGPTGENQTPKGTPVPVRLPSQVKLPQGAAVYQFGKGEHLIGPAGQRCSQSSGNGGGGSEIGGSGRYVRRSFPFTLGSIATGTCYYFPEAPQTRECVKADALPRRQSFPSGVPGVRAMVAGEAADKPTPMPPSPYVAVTVATMDAKGVPSSISCVMPWARASTCTAALTYWYVEAMSDTHITKAALDVAAQRIAAGVAAARH
ncbi:serine/threonine protein kinase [Actinomadura barringtoniae]|uniref:non-specific serine/threonine protein kinase n=1 Tax=Actinomadura barringtoniae TaxID=1427535 RepID=A0A939PKD9_9ACTN|nr:serine/threonine-protein kinase [Actinomadura barringtoniae]MBO2451469.1 serine/threonine protein kinase [Actinomadura barringtoniae]